MALQFLVIAVDVPEGGKRPAFQITSKPSVQVAQEWFSEGDWNGINPFAHARECQKLLDDAAMRRGDD